MKKFIFILFIFSFNASAQKLIQCQDDVCNANFDPELQLEKIFYSAIDAGVRNQEDIEVESNTYLQPRSTRLYIEQNNLLGQNLSVNLRSKSEDYNSSDFLLISDFIKNLGINLSGYDGVDGKKASQICAEEYQKGAFGAFGEEALQEFENRRLFDLTIPRDECVRVDQEYLLDNNFTCDQADFEEIDVNNPSVIVERLKGKNKCIGLSYMDICLSKTVEVTCTWRILYTDPPTVAGQFSTSNNYPDVHTKVFRMSEQEFLANRQNSEKIQYYCNNLTYNPIVDSPPKEIIKNGNFYFDLRDWDNHSMSWVNEKMKMIGGENQTVRPKAEQIIDTIPGRKYRVQAVFSKASEHSYVSGGYLKVWNNLNKDEELFNEYVYEEGAIDGVFLTSDQAPFHYNYIFEGTTSTSKEFTITNKDDRDAKNCSPPFIDGDSNDFIIVTDTCGEQDLAVGESCSITVRARPLSVGSKKGYIKRNCIDDFGNNTTQLNEEIYVVGWNNFIQSQDGNGNPIGFYTDGFYWRRYNLGSGDEWLRCVADYQENLKCNASSPIENIPQGLDRGKWYPGYNPQGMTIPNPLPTPTIENFPMVQNSSIDYVNQFSFKNIDFIFTATTNKSILELGSILKYHTGYFDTIQVTQLAETAGPDIKPPSDKLCPDPQNTPGCLSGELGNGFYELYGQPSYLPTSPEYDDTYYTIPEDSDWRIRYVEVNNSCPQYFTKIKTGHLASNIGYDDNDELCDDVYLPEDPASKIISWQFVGFERKAEFGTELIQCRLGDCLIDSSIRDSSRNLVDINPGSGTNGTQQGQGVLFLYDVENLSAISKNGKGGIIGEKDLPELSEERLCVKIKDAKTEGENSLYAIDPSVEFRRYNWKPLKIIENGNFGITPPDNGKRIHILKKLDSSSRYFLKNELF
jgi:hypothetical protein